MSKMTRTEVELIKQKGQKEHQTREHIDNAARMIRDERMRRGEGLKSHDECRRIAENMANEDRRKGKI